MLLKAIPLSICLLAIKLLFFIKTYQAAQKCCDLLKNVLIIFTYDIMTDIAIILRNIPDNLTPPWVNFFLGTGVLATLAKTHAIEKISTSINNNFDFKKKTKTFFLKKSSILLGLPHLISYIFLSLKHGLKTKIIFHAQRLKAEILISKFAVSIYSLVIVLPSIKNTLKTIRNKQLPLNIERDIHFFYYYGIIPKIIIDAIQTSTPQFIRSLLFHTSIKGFSLGSTIIASSFSVFFFIISYKTLRKIGEKSKLISASEEEPSTLNFDIQQFSMPTPYNYEKYIENTVLESAYNSIRKCTPQSFHPKCFVSSSSSHDIYHSKIQKLLSNQNINKILLEKNILIKSNLEVITKFEKNIILEDIHTEMSSLKVEAIIPWKRGCSISGCIALFYKEEYNISILHEKNIKKLLQIKASLQSFYTKYSENEKINLQEVKSHLIEQKANRMAHYQNEMFSSLLNTLFSHKPIFFSYKNKNLDKLPAQLEEDDTIKQACIIHCKQADSENRFIKKHGITKNNKTYTLFAFPKNNTLKFPHAIIVLFERKLPIPNTSKHNNSIKLFLEFTQPGISLNKILPTASYGIEKFKIEIMNFVTNPNPLLLIIQSKYAHLIIKLIAFIENTDTEIIDCKTQNFSESLFERFVIEDNYTATPYIKTLNSSSCIGLIDIELLDNKSQNILIEYCFSGYMPNKTQVKTKPNRFILTTQSPSYINAIDHTLLQGVSTHIISPPFIEELTDINEFKSLLKGLNIIFKFSDIQNLIDDEKSIYFFKIAKQKLWNIFDLIIHIQDSFKCEKFSDATLIQEKEEIDINNLYNHNESNSDELVIKKALKLGKDTLQNKKLMEHLLRICKSQSEIACLIGVHKSSITRAVQKIKHEGKKY